MCLITIFVGAVGFLLYWLGFLDRPKFQVIESILGLSKSTADRVFAIVTTVQDVDYIDNNMCTVLKATKKGIEKAIESIVERADDKSSLDDMDGKTKTDLSFATSYLISDDRTSSASADKKDRPHKDDTIGLTIFLQDPSTGECHRTALGFLVVASSYEYAQEIAKNATKIIQGDLVGGINVPNLDGSDCSHTQGSPVQPDSDGIYRADFVQTHAVALGSGRVFRGRVPIRSSLAFHVARYLHWGRAHEKYTALTSGAAVACEIYVQGKHNPAGGSNFVDLLYLLDHDDREAVWKQLDTPLP